MSQDLLNDVKQTIRGVLASTNTTFGLRELAKDYKSLDGSDIPFRELGYDSLLTFLRTIPDTVRLSHPDSSTTSVYLVPNSKTSHITKLISNQKPNSKSSQFRRFGRRPPPPPPRRRPDNFPPRLQRNFPKEDVITDEFRKDVFRFLEQYPEGLPVWNFDYEVDHISSNHLINCPRHEIENDLKKFIYVENERVYLRKDGPIANGNGAVNHQPPGRSSRLDHLEFSASDSEEDFEDDFEAYSHNSGVSDEYVAENMSRKSSNFTNGNYAEPGSNSFDNMSETIPTRVIKNIQTLIQAPENRNGIWLRDFLSKYLMMFNYALKPENYGFSDVLELVASIKDVIRLRRFRIEGDDLLLDATQFKPDNLVSEEENGDIPLSFINTLKKILTKRSNGSLCTDDLPTEYKKQTGCTFDPKEFGFSSMDSFLKNLGEYFSEFGFREVRGRTLIRLNSATENAKSSQNGNAPAILPNGPRLSPYPDEVCNADSKLRSNPLFDSLRKGDVFRAELAEVYTPWRFFVHHIDNIADLNRLMDDLNSFYMENEKEYQVEAFTAVKGLLCACTYSLNSKWHRVSIINTKLKTAKVKFVDYGTTEEVNINRLRYLHRDFAELSAMSVRVKLTCIQPKNIVDPEERNVYSSKLNNFFYQIASKGDLEATFIKYDPKNDCYEISLKVTPPNDSPFSLSDHLFNEKLVDIRPEEFVELPTADALPSTLFTPESLKPTKQTEQRPPSEPVNDVAAEKPVKSPSPPPVAPVVSPPPPQPPSPQKGPPPGLSLPSGAQSQNYNDLFSPPLMSKSKEASNIRGPKKTSVRRKNSDLCGTPLISQASMLNSPFGPLPVNVPPAFMTGLSCATSFDSLLMSQPLPQFGMPPSMPSYYASPGFRQFPQPYFFNQPFQQPPRPVAPVTPNHFPQFVQHPPPSVCRPPPGFSPLNFPPRPAYASPRTQPGFVAASPNSCQNGSGFSDHLPSHGRPYEPLVTIASTASTTTNKFEWPLTDPELASQWEKVKLSSLQPTEDPLLASLDGLKLDANPKEDPSAAQDAVGAAVSDASPFEDLIAVEKARERRGAESTLKKCFNFSQPSEVIENVINFLETQAKPQSSDASTVTSPKKRTESTPKDTTAAPRTSQPASTIPSPQIPLQERLATNFWEPKLTIQKDDVTLQMEAMLDESTKYSNKTNHRKQMRVGASPPASREADSASSPSQESSTFAASMDIGSAGSGAAPEMPKKTSKLDSIKQMVMQKRK